jgi:hypothetical protein
MKRNARPRRAARKAPPRILFGIRSIYLPARITGANVSIDALCRRLLSAGFDPVVVNGAGALEPQARSGVPPTPAYPVLPLADPVAALAEMVTHLAPSAVVLQGLELAMRAAAHTSLRDFPVRVMLVQNFVGQGIPGPAGLPHWRYAANSRFLADLASAFFATPVDVVPPLVEPGEYRVERAGQEVLFVNPVADKGVHVAAAIAKADVEVAVRPEGDVSAVVIREGLGGCQNLKRGAGVGGIRCRSRVPNDARGRVGVGDEELPVGLVVGMERKSEESLLTAGAHAADREERGGVERAGALLVDANPPRVLLTDEEPITVSRRGPDPDGTGQAGDIRTRDELQGRLRHRC